LASGLTERTSTRMLFALPMGMRTMDPRSIADAMSWLGLQNGDRDGDSVDARIQQQQMSLPCEMRSDEFPAHLAELLFSFFIPKRVLPFSLIGDVVCIPLPFTPTTG